MIKFKFILQIFIVLFLIIIFSMNSYSTMKDKENLSATEQLKIVYLELYQELLKLPDLKENTVRNRNALEKIACLGLSNENKTVFEVILDEGLKAKRKYCTPLEALLWIAYDRNFDGYNPLSDYSLNSLILNAWTTTLTSRNFSSKRWKDFNEVTDRLNSPKIIAIYMQKRFSYSYKKWEPEGVKSAKEIFKDGKGACYDYALFASYLLKKNGYDKAWGTAVKFDQLVDNFYNGHIGNIYQDPKDNLYYSMDFSATGYAVYGPFNTIKDAANHICYIGSKGGRAHSKEYTTYEIDLAKGRYIKALPYFF